MPRDYYQLNYKNAKMLIVEGNEDQWALIQQAMQQSLPQVPTARTASFQQTIEILHDWQHQEWEIPKLILLDPGLPALTDGWQLLNQIKAMPDPINLIPVIVWSCSTAQADTDQAYQLGASCYLVKPTAFPEWQTCLLALRRYWWETVSLPATRYVSEHL